MTHRKQYTESEALALHEYRRQADPGHDQVKCWCHCPDCGFDVQAVIAASVPQPRKGENDDTY
jgi:hypothetical protein